MQSDQELSKNQIPAQDVEIVIRLPTKHSASNLLQAKAANDELPTIATPSTPLHQSRPISSRPAAVMNVAMRTGAGEQAPPLEGLAPPGETALRSPCLAGSFEETAAAKPPVVKENTVRLPKCKSLRQQGALEPTKDNKNTQDNELTGQPRGKSPQNTNVRRDKGRPETPKAMRDPMGPRVTSEVGRDFTTLTPPVAPRGDTHGISTSCFAVEDQDDKQAEGQEAASAQAVNRGHNVHMYKIPDDEDDTSFMMNKKTNLIPTI